MRIFIKLLLLFLTIIYFSCGKSPETLVEGGYDEKEMDAAISLARTEVDSFITELSKGSGTNFAIKAPIEDSGETEHFWLTDIVYQNDEFEGKIGNEPGIVSNVKIGQKWTIKKSEISDWMFIHDDKIYGNYTLRPLLKSLPEEEAAQYRSILADP